MQLRRNQTLQCTPLNVTLTVRVLLVRVGNKPAVVLIIQYAVIVVIVVAFISLTEKNILFYLKYGCGDIGTGIKYRYQYWF